MSDISPHTPSVYPYRSDVQRILLTIRPLKKAFMQGISVNALCLHYEIHDCFVNMKSRLCPMFPRTTCLVVCGRRIALFPRARACMGEVTPGIQGTPRQASRYAPVLIKRPEIASQSHSDFASTISGLTGYRMERSVRPLHPLATNKTSQDAWERRQIHHGFDKRDFCVMHNLDSILDETSLDKKLSSFDFCRIRSPVPPPR